MYMYSTCTFMCLYYTSPCNVITVGLASCGNTLLISSRDVPTLKGIPTTHTDPHMSVGRLLGDHTYLSFTGGYDYYW